MLRTNEAVRESKKTVRGIKTILMIFFSVCSLFMLLLLPSQSMSGARAGITLCAEIVIPSLFPFLVLSSFVINIGLAQKFGRILEPIMRFLFSLPGASAAALGLGIIGGYPVGAKACADLCKKGALTKNEANRLLGFCINSSPSFIIGAVGTGLLKSAQAGMLLYCAHITASILVGIISSAFTKRSSEKHFKTTEKTVPISTAFVGAVTGSAASIVNICAFVVLFSAISDMISGCGVTKGMALIAGNFFGSGVSSTVFDTLIKGLLEVSNGCAAVAAKGLNPVLLISIFLSWSGFSVVFQVLYAVREAGLSVKYYLLSRLLHIMFSVLLTWVLFSIFPVALPAFAGINTGIIASIHSTPASTALLIFCALLLLSQVTV